MQTQQTATQTPTVPQHLQDRSPAITQHLKSVGSSSPPVLQGRVFERLNRFAGLPSDLQDDMKQFQAFVEQNKHMLFETNHHALVIPVYSIKGEALVNAIIQWLQERAASPATSPSQTTAATTATSIASVPKTPLTKTARGTIYISSELLNRAKQIAEALLLSGFITPYMEDDTNLRHLDGTAPAHYVHDHELLVPVGKNVAEFCTTTVWSVIDGAIYARYLKRKAGMLGQFTDGKDVYVVLNERTKKAYLFASDVARESITEMIGESVNVQFDNDRFDFGVRVALNSGFDQKKGRLFNAESKRVQEEFVNAWLSIGAQYRDSKIMEMLL
jgi:hypothetical protein